MPVEQGNNFSLQSYQRTPPSEDGRYFGLIIGDNPLAIAVLTIGARYLSDNQTCARKQLTWRAASDGNGRYMIAGDEEVLDLIEGGLKRLGFKPVLSPDEKP